MYMNPDQIPDYKRGLVLKVGANLPHLGEDKLRKMLLSDPEPGVLRNVIEQWRAEDLASGRAYTIAMLNREIDDLKATVARIASILRQAGSPDQVM